MVSRFEFNLICSRTDDNYLCLSIDDDKYETVA